MVRYARSVMVALLACSLFASAFAYQYTVSDSSFTIKDDDTSCTSTTCVVRPVVCNEAAFSQPVAVTLDFATVQPTLLSVDGKALQYEVVDSPVMAAQSLAEPVSGGKLVLADEPVLGVVDDRHAIAIDPVFAAGECKVVETTVHPVFGGVYKYSVFANGFELDPFVNATLYTIGYNTASNWTADENAALTTATLPDGNTSLELKVTNG